MKILLINPPRFNNIPVVREVRCAGMSPVSVYPPLKLLYIAGYLRKHKVNVSLIDANGDNLNFDYIKKSIKKIKPDVVLFSTSPTTMSYDNKVAELAKKISQKIIVILDDSHISPANPKLVLNKFRNIDILIKGESELTTLNILKNITTLKKVNGISYRVKNKIIDNLPAEPLNLDLLESPAYDLVNPDNYYSFTFGKERRLGIILTSVSCPFNCSFCIIGGATVWRGDGKKWRAKSPKKVLEEILDLYHKFNIKNFYFFDETFTVDKKRVIDICRLIKKHNLNIVWSCNSRVDTVDKKTLKHMQKAGCFNICFGLESGSQKILNSVNKETDLDQAVEIFKECQRMGIKTSASFMIGLPEESESTLKETLDFAKRLNPDRAQFVITTAYPGTRLYDQVKKEKLLEKDYNFSGFDAYGINNEAVLKSKYLTAKEISEYSKKMYLSFYLRPLQIWNLLTGIRTIDDIINLFVMLKSL